MLYIYSYNKHSETAKKLKKELLAQLINVDVKLHDIPEGSIIINWGSSKLEAPDHHVIQPSEGVRNAVDKIKTFALLKESGVSTVPWTTNPFEAYDWNCKTVARTNPCGSDGEGIIIIENTSPAEFMRVAHCTLFTKFVKARNEYRVNTTRDKCFGVQKKVPIADNYNPDLKTTSGGYGFHLCQDYEIPYGIRPIAKKAIEALGLAYGGVDIVVAEDDKPYILEVNSAPQLTPAMVRGLAKELRKMI